MQTTRQGARIITVAVLCAGVGLSGDSIAETVQANSRAVVMDGPGEKKRVVVRVRPGKKLKVLAKRNRWLKVRVNGRTGWVTRSSVQSTRQARQPERKTRRRPFVQGRSKRRTRRARRAPRDRIGADAVEVQEDILDDDELDADPVPRTRRRERREKPAETAPEVLVVSAFEAELFNQPSSRSRSVELVEKGDQLTVVRHSASGKWVLVKNEDGQRGWINKQDVSNAPFTYPKWLTRADAQLGFSQLAMAFSTPDGVGELANYQIKSRAATVNIGSDVVYNYSPTYLIGVDAAYTLRRATPGIRYQTMDGTAQDIGFTAHDLSVGAKVGYNLKSATGMVVYGRLGYHYGKMAIHDVNNAEVNLAKLPSEIFRGITMGARVDVPRLREKIGLRLAADAMYPGGIRNQTPGLEDGATSRVFAVFGTAHLTYKWKKKYNAELLYRYTHTVTNWAGTAMNSTRGHNATSAERTDTGHTVTVGLGKKF